VDGEGAPEVVGEPDVQHLAPLRGDVPGGYEPSARGARPRFLALAQTLCVCQRVIGPPGVLPCSPRVMLNIIPTRISGYPGMFA
jgi:hypothetical protein